MTDRWANIAFFYLTVTLVMSALIVIMDTEMTDNELSQHRLFDEDENILSEGIPDTDIELSNWYEDNIFSNFAINTAALVGADELARLGFEFVGTVLDVGSKTLPFIVSAPFVYFEVLKRIFAAFGLPQSFAEMISGMMFIAQILAIIIVAARVREVLRR